MMSWVKVLLVGFAVSLLAIDGVEAKNKKGGGKGKSKSKRMRIVISDDQYFKSPDLDGDGELSAEELQKYYRWPTKEFFTCSGIDGSLNKVDFSRLNKDLQVTMFKNMDLNKDGLIAESEFKATLKKTLKKKYKMAAE